MFRYKAPLAVILVSLLGLLEMGLTDGKHKLTFTFLQDGNDCQFNGSFEVRADPQVVWDVLADYDNRSRYVANMYCHVRQRDGNNILMEMTVGGGFLFIREEVKGLLKAEEDPLKSVSFEEVTHKKFDVYRGIWAMQPVPPGKEIKVTYQIETKKNKATPGFVTPEIIRQSSEDFMVQMKREMERREIKMPTRLSSMK